MALPRFQYTGSWENPADFPTHEYSEAQVRRDIMRFFTEIQTYLNRTLLPLLDAGSPGAGGGDGPSGDFLPKSGGQMTGPLLLYDNPTNLSEAATKEYVDTTSSLIAEGLDGAIAALTVEVGRIQAIVDDGLGNVTEITITPGRIETLLQDDLGRIMEMLLSAEQMRVHFQDGAQQSGMEMSAEEFRLWFEGVAGRLSELLMNDSEIRARVEDAAAGLSTQVSITPDGLTSEVTDLFNQVKSLLEQNPDKIAAAVTRTLEDGSTVGTEFTLTPEQIAAIARGVNGELAEMSIAPDQITQTVKDGLTREAVLELISQQIQAYVRNEVSESSLALDPEQIRLQVIDAITHDSTILSLLRGQIQAQITGLGGSSSLTLTDQELRELVVGPDHADDFSDLTLTSTGIYGTVRNHTGQIAALNTTADEINAAVQNQSGQLASLSLRADGIQTAVEQQGESLSSIRQTAESIVSRVEDAETDINGLNTQYSQISQTVNGITLETHQDGADAVIELSIPGRGAVSGLIRMTGNVDVSGSLSADALYSRKGEIADLAVDQLSTSRRIVMYLRGDTSDDNFIRIHNQSVEWVAGHCLGSTEQARTPDGHLLYWEQDITGCSLTADGYPVADGVRVFTTTTQTAYQTTVYQYREEVKRSIRFDTVGSIYTPVDTYGAGNAQGWNIGRIVKSVDGFDLLYTSNSNGREVGIRMTNDGFVDIIGLRRTAGLNFSGWDSGSFSETVSGRSAPVGYHVSFDSRNRPVSITDSGGQVLTIQW